MRTFLGVMLAAAVAAPASVRAADGDKPGVDVTKNAAAAIIEKAIKAHGGAEALNKAQKRTRSGQGVIVLNKNEVPFKTEETVGFPGRCRVDLDLGKTRLVVVLNGDKGWMQAGGASQPMDKASYTERRDELYVWWLMTLTPLLKDDFELKPLADAKVNGQDAAVVKVSRKDRPVIRLYFDKKSGLLLKIARRGENAGVPITMEYQYRDHKEFDGVKWPATELTTMNGNKLSEVKFASYKSLDRVEDKTFEKP
ncbi:MAG TPA: hypothetical protein VH643_13835 [Gemmataceae bacterium]